MKYNLFEDDKVKMIRSETFNYNFSKLSGYFERWGRTKDENPEFCPFGPELMDIEISINGCPNNCAFCYKDNKNIPPTNMSFETFKTICDKLPKTVTQIAFGITGVQTNPDFIKIMEYSRNKGIVPNFTLSGIDLTNELAEKCSKLVGALAVSAYSTNKNICYDTVRKFTNLGVEQTKIHAMLSKQSLPFISELLHDYKNDNRLKNLNAIVFLSVKPKGRAKIGYNPVSQIDYNNLVNKCLSENIPFGFDSCGAGKFLESVKNHPKLNQFKTLAEKCESTCFSFYLNTFGKAFACSFCENEPIWKEGLDVLNCQDFVKDIWYHPQTVEFRNKLIKNNRNCPAFEI
jgi:hypothetical protein